MDQGIRAINERVQRESAFVQDLQAEVGKIIVGQEKLVGRLIIGLLADGHILIEGVPGLAKTLSVKTLADAIQAKFQRIQFTPDLLPADLIGTLVYNQQSAQFMPRLGPIFANFILADEINRAPAKVQSALLEAMQERQVTIGDTTYPLDEPFLVLATQNPIEQEGTYPLPEAQLDRFMLKVIVSYPDRREERFIMDRMTVDHLPPVQPVISQQEIVAARELVREIYVDEKIKEYVLDIVFATREPAAYQLGNLSTMIAYGASPRATIYLIQAAKAQAFLNGRGYVTPDDIKQIALDVLRHRVIVTYEAEAEEMTGESIVQHILDEIEVP
jgi:MoxR-like ATPase